MDVEDTMTPINGLNGIIPPSHRIPPEIVAKIIRRTLPTKIRYGHPMRGRIKALLVATSICQYWRYAVLDHATLWSVVPIHRKTLGPLYLQRSCNAPLSIVFNAEAQGACSAHQAVVLLLPHVQRVKKVQFFAPSQALNEIFSTLDQYGAHLDEIGLEVMPAPVGEGWTVIFDHLLKHASTLRVLQLDVYEFHFHTHQFQQFPHLARLELSGIHDLCDLSHLLTSFPTLTSIKVGLEAIGSHDDYHRLPDQIIPLPNLRHIHLQAGCYPIKVVIDALKIRTGVHLECEIVGCRHGRGAGQARFLPLPSEFLQNTSCIEELSIHESVYFKCCGSGPSGSFYIGGFFAGKVHRPVEDLSHLRRLAVADVIEQGLLEDIVISAPRLSSLVFNNCVVSKSWAIDRAVEGQPSFDVAVDTDTFVKTISEERHTGTKNLRSVTVHGVLEGERLKKFRSTIINFF